MHSSGSMLCAAGVEIMLAWRLYIQRLPDSAMVQAEPLNVFVCVLAAWLGHAAGTVPKRVTHVFRILAVITQVLKTAGTTQKLFTAVLPCCCAAVLPCCCINRLPAAGPAAGLGCNLPDRILFVSVYWSLDEQ